jgi:ABC-type nitrate/sulfonate/bicarbonate transport system substrate-binding protein
MIEPEGPRQATLSRRALLGGGLKLAGGAALLGGLGQMGEMLFGSAQASAAPMMADINFQLGWLTNTEFAGSYLAASKGYYSKAGLSVKILPGEGVDVEGIVGAGKALVGDSNADTCSAAVAQGADLKVIGAKYQKNPFCIISSAKKPIKTPQELISKKVGVNAYNFTAQRRSPKASAGPDADADGSGRDGRGACVVTAAGRG